MPRHASSRDSTRPERPDPQRSLHSSFRARLWMAAGALALAVGVIGIFLPLLPTTPFVLLAAFCFARGNARWERWLLAHPRLGPIVRDWRATRAVPLSAKIVATATMLGGCAWSFYVLSSFWRILPSLCCLAVATWLWSLPTRRGHPPA